MCVCACVCACVCVCMCVCVHVCVCVCVWVGGCVIVEGRGRERRMLHSLHMPSKFNEELYSKDIHTCTLNPMHLIT